jgi:hypothetical protein
MAMDNKERLAYDEEKQKLSPDNFSSDLLKEWGLDVVAVHNASSQAETGLRFCSPAPSDLAESRRSLMAKSGIDPEAPQSVIENRVIASRAPTRELIRKTVRMDGEREKLGLKGEGFSHNRGAELLGRVHPSNKRRKKEKEAKGRQKRKKAWKTAD